MKKKKTSWKTLAGLAAAAAAFLKYSADLPIYQETTAPSCPVGEIPRWFGTQQILNGRKVGPGWVCLPVDVKKL